MSKEWKDRLEKICVGTITAVAVVILTALIKGDALKGLGKLAAFVRILNFGVPLWLFIAVLVTAILGAISWVQQSSTAKTLYVVWDPVQCLWSRVAQSFVVQKLCGSLHFGINLRVPLLI